MGFTAFGGNVRKIHVHQEEEPPCSYPVRIGLTPEEFSGTSHLPNALLGLEMGYSFWQKGKSTQSIRKDWDQGGRRRGRIRLTPGAFSGSQPAACCPVLIRANHPYAEVACTLADFPVFIFVMEHN